MHLAPGKIKTLAKKNGLSLDSLLKKAGVSKTAYYHLVRSENLLPKSILALARVLGVSPADFIEEANIGLKRVEALRK
jgi:transcriptional regulator with XRE-family HTH domain